MSSKSVIVVSDSKAWATVIVGRLRAEGIEAGTVEDGAQVRPSSNACIVVDQDYCARCRPVASRVAVAIQMDRIASLSFDGEYAVILVSDYIGEVGFSITDGTTNAKKFCLGVDRRNSAQIIHSIATVVKCGIKRLILEVANELRGARVSDNHKMKPKLPVMKARRHGNVRTRR